MPPGSSGRNLNTNILPHGTEQGRYSLPSLLHYQVPLCMYAQHWLPSRGVQEGPCYNRPLERKQLAAGWEDGVVGSPCPSPRASCVQAGPHRAYSPLQGHTKTSLSIMGDRHQREGKTERAKEVRQEGGGGAENGKGKKAHVSLLPKPVFKKNKKVTAELQGHICLDSSATISEPETGQVPASDTP